MTTTITRWHPSTCGCIVEYEVDDFNNTGSNEIRFLLMNHVCDKHQHLASTTHRANHVELSKRPIELVEAAKQRNKSSHQQSVNEAKTKLHKKQLELLAPQIQQHNDNITEEWNELVSRPHAFDSHIYEQILKEQKEANG